MDEKLSVMTPESLRHEEFPLHIYTAADGEQIPYTLHLLLENMKKQYLTMIQTMQTKVGIQEVFLSFGHCKHFSIYVFPKKIWPSLIPNIN